MRILHPEGASSWVQVLHSRLLPTDTTYKSGPESKRNKEILPASV